MDKILRKRIFREFKANIFRYVALALMMIMGMYLVVAIVGAADMIADGTDKNTAKYNTESGEFSVQVPLNADQLDSISQIGVETEEKFSFDINVSDTEVLRVMKNRERINILAVDEGAQATADDEVLIEKRYAETHNLSVGETINILDKGYRISGIGCAMDYDAPFKEITDISVESDKFGLAFFTGDEYERIRDKAENIQETLTYAYSANNKDDELKNLLADMEFSEEQLSDPVISAYLSAGYDAPPLLTSFITAEDNVRIRAAADDFAANKSSGLAAGVIIMILVTYVISVFTVHSINEESQVIGVLYAMGLKKRTLLLYYMTLPTIIVFISGIIGMLLGFSSIGINVMVDGSRSYYSFPELSAVYPPYLIIYCTVVPVVVCILVNLIFISRRLSTTALSLMRNEKKVGRTSGKHFKFKSFIRTFQVANVIKESKAALAVVFGMFVSLLVFMIAMDSNAVNKNTQKDMLRDTHYEYLYTYRYNDGIVPENAEPVYTKVLSKNLGGYTLNVNIMGIYDNNPYFDFNAPDEFGHIVIGNSVAEKYGVKKGDVLKLDDQTEDKEYSFWVDDIVQYSVGLTVFMNIDNMRDVFDCSSNYFNAVLSNSELNIPEDQLLNMVSRNDIVRSTDVFVNNMKRTTIIFTVVSIIIFVVVMYLMMNMMVKKNSYNISLAKIFGFRSGEIRKMYLDGNAYIIGIGALICVPVSKLLINGIFPSFALNVASGMNFTYPFYAYIIVYAAIMLLYFIINRLLMMSINRITPAEVLKNRE